ncbi:MAG TPA: hypothetical protein VL866_05055 [Pyrinomonadaceae bacterium]|nr:hypothetical protein [Pyrinomonadaceae bacterium]
MKNLEWSDATSNLLIFSSVLLAFTPFVLGDQLVLIASSAIKEGGVMIDQFGAYLTSFF